MEFTSEFLNGYQIRATEGTQKLSGIARYKGKIYNFKRAGKGVMTFTNGCTLNGFWKEDFPIEGYFKFRDGTSFKGKFKEGQLEGFGKFVSSKGDVYEGNWKNSLFNGKGKLIWSNGARYIGTFLDGKKHGLGTYTYQNGC